ncbi:GBS Bsp-like repeat-containing protein, partial [Streptococcus sp. DD12]|uniref:GBS Bsp-like repeat-containing protein n=1 Tax=Streptococcus sp. DD12 TaxID=1777880 RepID=UPI000B2FDC7A
AQTQPDVAQTQGVSASQAATAGGDQSTVEVTSASVEAQGIQLQYNQSIGLGEVIRFAVWTDKNGQDDLQWIDANASGAAFIEFSRHREYGKYHIHTYSSTRGGLNARTLDVTLSPVQATITQTGESSYQVTVSHVSPTLSSLSLPVWSDANGQDDLRWITATKTGAGTFVATITTPEWGHYNLHIYGQSQVTGGSIGLLATSGINHVDGRANAKVSVTDYAKDKTRFTVNVIGTSPSDRASSKNQTKTIQSVSIAAWSKDKGQDDLKWYSPRITNNSAQQVVDIKDLSNTSDTYIVHVYTTYTDGSRVGEVAGELNIQKPSEQNQVTAKQGPDGIQLQLTSNSISDLSTVRFAVWSEANGQDDLKWYRADANGQALAPYRNHKGTGVYNIHAYQEVNGQVRGLTTTTLTIAPAQLTTSIQRQEEGVYQVTISNVPYYLTDLTLPVWSDIHGQDDLRWVKATPVTETSYTATIYLKDHDFNTGHYSVHVYAQNQLDAGKQVGLMATQGFQVDS